ncbi:MAG: 5-formyltetrahydrofolate cyclo-ligase [Rhodovibrionaceae bacterium]|nr:5-formyltetrahydrofolate cyclo-ligase [Rhodovibrionaceae bacterium]
MVDKLAEIKKDLRKTAKARRAEAAKAAPQAGEEVAAQVLGAFDLPQGAPVSGYWPMGDELDIRPLLTALAERGHEIGLPVVVQAGAPLVFRRWRPGDELIPAGFGTQVPQPEQPEITPRVLFVPLLAFDRRGFRLGYGGGFYDRTLARLSADGGATAVGVAYAGQEMEAIPRDDYDWPLDWIVTEREALHFESLRAT